MQIKNTAIVLSGAISLILAGACSNAMANGPFASKTLDQNKPLTEAQEADLLNTVQPMPLPELSVPPALNEGLDVPDSSSMPEPSIMPGTPGKTLKGGASGRSPDDAEVKQAADDIQPMNYGRGNRGTPYHFTDYKVPGNIINTHPYRTIGWFVFTASNGNTYRCSAQLIANSIIATAGHCVHDGGNQAAGWIKSGTFYPAYASGMSTYGKATAAKPYTTSGWYNTGSLDKGYDVALVVLNKKAGTTVEIGRATGTLGFCYSNCLQSYWYNSQLGYPGNYDGGAYLNQSEHLEISDSRDYKFGSGMSSGSSGGGHIANLGSLNVTSGTAGQYNLRNILFAVMSWGYTDETLKIGGASSLSGPSNSNNFKVMYNAACTYSRRLHGSTSCSILP